MYCLYLNQFSIFKLYCWNFKLSINTKSWSCVSWQEFHKKWEIFKDEKLKLAFCFVFTFHLWWLSNVLCYWLDIVLIYILIGVLLPMLYVNMWCSHISNKTWKQLFSTIDICLLIVLLGNQVVSMVTWRNKFTFKFNICIITGQTVYNNYKKQHGCLCYESMHAFLWVD